LAVAINQQGDLFVADSGNYAIKKVSKDGIISTLSLIDEKEEPFSLKMPKFITYSSGALYVVENNQNIQRIIVGLKWNKMSHKYCDMITKKRVQAIMLLAKNPKCLFYRLPLDVVYIIISEFASNL